MTPDQNTEEYDERTTTPPPAPSPFFAPSLALPILAAGMIAGFAAGWVSFASPWSSLAKPNPLYDEDLVTSLFETAGRAVVEIHVATQGRGGRPSQESGSGFLVDEAGHIATNHHVLAGGDDVIIEMFDGRRLPARKLGSSPADDLALLKVDPEAFDGIEPLALADSDKVTPGELAIAIGSPFRQRNSMTVGIVSGVGRSRRSLVSRPIPDLIQTDAALNPGNSGGPLLNAKGEVIGINTSVEVFNLVQTGVGFAVSSNTLRGILRELQSPGLVRRPWIGITSIPRESAVALGLSADGVHILRVCPNSPADIAGLRGESPQTGSGDAILAVDGVRVDSVADMVDYFNGRRPLETVEISIVRDRTRQNVKVTLAEWPYGLTPGTLWSPRPGGSSCPPAR